jgi:biopolymer transport protein ExbB
MNTSPFRVICRVVFALAMLSLAQPSFAQQKAAPQAPVSSQPPAVASQAPAPVAAVQSAPAADAAATPTDSSRSLKSTAVTQRELSPWSMFLSADILVKAVMIGLAFASLVTWTIFIAKMIELSFIQRRLRRARQDQRCQVAVGGAVRARRKR